jgi:plastocyanin
MRKALVLFGGLVVLGSVVVASCGGDGNSQDEEAIEQLVVDVPAALNSNDMDALLGLVTEDFLADQFGFPITKERAREEHAAGTILLGDPPVTLEGLEDIEISGDTATALVWERQAASREPLRQSFVKEDDTWLMGAIEPVAVDTPPGATEVQVEAVDNRFTLENDSFPAGDVVFQVTNGGTQAHDMFVVKLPDGVSVADAYDVADPSEVGAQWVGLFGPGFESGKQATWVLEDLEPGRYGYYCWIDQSGTPHAYLGMEGEFTVE